jgi:hypothetical protein
MIALCPEHHGLADGGHYSIQQLRALKKHPYVDDRLKVRWPWASETLVMKAGPHLVVGHGSPLIENFAPGKVEKFWLDRGFIMDGANPLEVRYGDRILLRMG